MGDSRRDDGEESAHRRQGSTTGASLEPDIEVRYDPRTRRFEARIPHSADIAFIDVVPGERIWSLTHTEVPPSFRGKGVGSALVRGALDHVRSIPAHVKPVCPFVAEFLKSNPEETDVVEPRYRYLIE